MIFLVEFKKNNLSDLDTEDIVVNHAKLFLGSN